MSLTYIEGSLLDTEIVHIIHGCNAKGVMSAGVAKQIRAKYPKAYKDYRKQYKTNGFDLGSIVVSIQPCGKVIHNAIIQKDYGTQQRQVSYSAIEKVFRKIDKWPLKELAMPQIGAGLAGGDWNIIKDIIEKSLKNVKPYVYII